MGPEDLQRNTYGQDVRHLECPFYFAPRGCKWTACQCKYAHHQTGERAGKPQYIRGVGCVAGENRRRARRSQMRGPWRAGTQTPSPEPETREHISEDAASSSETDRDSSPEKEEVPSVITRVLCAKCLVGAPERGFCLAPGCGRPRCG